MNNDGNLRHNNVSAWSVFVNASGEWKLGGLEYVSTVDGIPMPPVKVPPSLEIYDPPEKTDQSKLRSATKWYDTIVQHQYLGTLNKIMIFLAYFIAQRICGA